MYSCCDWNIEQIKETCQFRHDAKWNSDTVTISSDEYGAMCAKIDANVLEEISSKSSTKTKDDIQVIINGHRYNLS